MANVKGYTYRRKGKLVTVRPHARASRGGGGSLGFLSHSPAKSKASRTRVGKSKLTYKGQFAGNPKSDRDVVAYFQKMTMGELRHRQDLTTQQIGMAHKQRNTKALEHLRR